MVRVILLLLVSCTGPVIEVGAKCTGPTCPPVVGNVHRKAKIAGPNCTSVLLSSRIILGPADCLYDVKLRKRHQHIRFVQGQTNVSVTQAALADPNSGRMLSVGLLQSTSGSVNSGLEWSTSSIEDIDIRGTLPGMLDGGCKSTSPVKDAYMVERSSGEPVAYKCSGSSGNQALGMPLYRQDTQGQPSVFALDAGRCDSAWGTARLRGARCATRVGKEAYLSVCRFAAKYKQTVKGCDDVLLQHGDNRTSNLIKTADVYDGLKKIPTVSSGLLVLHCQSGCVVCQGFVRVFDKLALHKSLARTTRLVRLEDVTLRRPPYTTIPYIEYRARGSREFREYTGPLTREDLLEFLLPKTRQKRSGRKRPRPFCEPVNEPNKRPAIEKTRELVEYNWKDFNERSEIESKTRDLLFKLTNNDALVLVDVSDITTTSTRDTSIRNIASIFMEVTDSPNINFKLDGDSQGAGYAWSQTETTYLERELGGTGTRLKREVINWNPSCSSVFVKKNLAPLPCSGTQLCYRIKSKNKMEAVFAVCYDTGTRTPIFTCHVIRPSKGSGRHGTWKQESGSALKPGALSSLQATDEDYKKAHQKTTSSKYYLARGHLVPNADFQGDAERQKLTFHLTNAAPQWQPANNGNWKHLETRIRQYAVKVKRDLYVVTGTGDYKSGKLLNKRVGIPAVFWKAVCDPGLKASVLYWSTNPNGVTSSGKTKACNKSQSDARGVVECLPVATLVTRLGLANFDVFPNAECGTSIEALHVLLNIDFK